MLGNRKIAGHFLFHELTNLWGFSQVPFSYDKIGGGLICYASLNGITFTVASPFSSNTTVILLLVIIPL